jgi:hypothetical protein
MKSVSEFQQRLERNDRRSITNTKTLEALEQLVNNSMETQDHVPCRIIPYTINPRFFHREKLMKQIESHLQPSIPGSVKIFKAFLLHGLGGSGKTQLATQFVYTHWEDYDVIIWIGAGNDQTLAEDFLEAANTLGIVRDGNEIAVRATLKRWLSETSESIHNNTLTCIMADDNHRI